MGLVVHGAIFRSRAQPRTAVHAAVRPRIDPRSSGRGRDSNPPAERSVHLLSSALAGAVPLGGRAPACKGWCSGKSACTSASAACAMQFGGKLTTEAAFFFLFPLFSCTDASGRELCRQSDSGSVQQNTGNGNDELKKHFAFAPGITAVDLMGSENRAHNTETKHEILLIHTHKY